MKKILTMALIILFSAAPARVLAKGATTRVVIEGPALGKPIEITDRKILRNFNVWTGPGTFSHKPGFHGNAPSFIIDWSQGSMPDVEKALEKYRVFFYAGDRNESPIYVVYYAVARSSEPGYVYLPGRGEEWWQLNVKSILRGVEGKWFHAWSTWENIARPLIEKTKTANSTHVASVDLFRERVLTCIGQAGLSCTKPAARGSNQQTKAAGGRLWSRCPRTK